MPLPPPIRYRARETSTERISNWGTQKVRRRKKEESRWSQAWTEEFWSQRTDKGQLILELILIEISMWCKQLSETFTRYPFHVINIDVLLYEFYFMTS